MSYVHNEILKKNKEGHWNPKFKGWWNLITNQQNCSEEARCKCTCKVPVFSFCMHPLKCAHFQTRASTPALYNTWMPV